MQNFSLSPDNETNMVRYGNVFLCHHVQECYELLKMVRFLVHPVHVLI